jgi:hypothetical protein
MIRVNPATSSAFLLREILHHLPLAALMLGLAACGGEHSSRSSGGPTGPDDGGNKTPVPRMEARGIFFDGQVEAEVLLARAGASWAHKDESGGTGKADQSSGGGHFSGGGGGMGGGHGGGHRGGGRGGENGGGAPAGGADSGPQSPPIHAINQPGVQLRLRLTNHREAPIVVEVVDFNSDLGDFVVLPEKITVRPGEAVEADPMVSRLGVGAAEIPVTMKLRVEGKSDQQVLTLKVVKEAAPAAPPPVEGASAQAATNPPPPQTPPPPQ